MDRRHFLRCSTAAVAATSLSSIALSSWADKPAAGEPPFKISLAEWSLHRTLRSGKLDNLDFAKTAKQEFGILAIEYVNQFFKDKANDQKYLAEMKKRAADEGVESLLIMCDGEGKLGDGDPKRRQQAVENHYKWVEAAKFLGCHSIRVNAASNGTYEEQQERAAAGLRALSEFAKPHGLNVIVENHGGLSSNGKWLSSVIETVDMDNCGTLPDFGNFTIRRGDNPEVYDRYQGVRELMPFAKAVSAKTHDFDEAGNEKSTDYEKMMDIVLEFGYHGYVGIEYEGGRLSEYEGIRKSKELLERVASRQPA
ncbi:Xylose isomerase-like TIM barrel [Roseimaritima multifibrata]|uniref:Xylose isomerase-like TIM barrel n=1 Tax=Roseimaritima multifibrata TaxID=1930274 RepID=A0A517MD32_9BACT|nr:sugar phosphate isomerase/epimerase family protein [Roseimaritima multifibrata]QDS92687.1 Xylose isomerase-like TIM barrel [Roseimaritima multifibrata]